MADTEQIEEDEELVKQRLAEEIAQIERELERKRLEEEIRRMEAMIANQKQQQAATAAAQDNNPQQESQSIARGNASMIDDGDMTASYDHSEFGIEDEGEIIEIEADEEYDEEEYVEYEEEYEEEIYIEEDDDDDDEIIEEIIDDGESYMEDEYDEIEYVDEEVDDGYEDFGGHESFMVTGNDSFAGNDSFSPSTLSATNSDGVTNLFDAVKSAAAARNDRLEDSGELHFQDYTPVESKEQQNKKPDAFDLSMAVSKKAQERETRLKEGGEKKMTTIKAKSEYKLDFKTICLEAAELGRLTRLKEHIVESEAKEKTPEEEWKSKGLLAIQWRTQHMSVIHEAARAGAASKLPERVTSNYESEEEDGEYDESSATVKRVSERMKELLNMSKTVGGGQEKIDKLIMGRKEENAHRTNQHDGPAKIVRPRAYYESADPSKIKLPRRKAPKVDPQKNLERIQAKFKGTYREDLPLSNISNEVAERAWARRTRLDRPGSLPRVQEICNCPYCIDPTPFQTYAYREIDKKRKEDGYESPDSEEERRQAREKRRAERRKNRPNRRRGDPGSHESSDSGISLDGERPIRRGRPRSMSDDSMSSTDMMSSGGELPMMRPPVATKREPPVAPKPEVAAPPAPRRATGKIGQAARRMSVAHQALERQSSDAGKADSQPPPSQKPRRVVRKRSVAKDKAQSENGKAGPRSRARAGSARSSARNSARSSTGAKKVVRRSKRAGGGRPGATTTTSKDGKTTTTTTTTGEGEGPSTTRTKVITKADGTRVVQRVVTRAPTKVVTRKVVVKGADGKVKKVSTSSTPASANGQARGKAGPPAAKGAAKGAPNVTVVTREGGARVTTKTTTTTGQRAAPNGKRSGFWRKSKS